MLQPLGWVDVSRITAAASPDLVLCKPRLQVSCPSVDMGFTLRVERDFRWTLFLSSEEVHSSSLLDCVSETLDTVSSVMSLLTRLNDPRSVKATLTTGFESYLQMHLSYTANIAVCIANLLVSYIAIRVRQLIPQQLDGSNQS